MRVYFSIHPIDETICVVDLRQILRQQELYEAEYELVLRNSHSYTKLGLSHVEIVRAGVTYEVHAVIDATADIGHPVHEEIEVAEGKRPLV